MEHEAMPLLLNVDGTHHTPNKIALLARHAPWYVHSAFFRFLPFIPPKARTAFS
jgi:hypothetical protein